MSSCIITVISCRNSKDILAGGVTGASKYLVLANLEARESASQMTGNETVVRSLSTQYYKGMGERGRIHRFKEINKMQEDIIIQKPKSTAQLFSTYQLPVKEEKIRSQRDELVNHFVQGINKERLGTKFKPITAKQVALRLNANPHFKGQDGEIYMLLKECQQKGTFKKFFWSCPLPIVKYIKK